MTTIDYRLKGGERKAMGELIADYTGMECVYNKTPHFTYSIGDLVITKDGKLQLPDDWDDEEIHGLKQYLKKNGFVSTEDDSKSKLHDPAAEVTYNDVNLTVAVARETLPDQAIQNLQHLLDTKGVLITRALKVDSLNIRIDEDSVTFPWFNRPLDLRTANAYTHFISALCEMARSQKRVVVRYTEPENEKYAFRCFLLRLGFIGEEYKDDRKILLQNLSGSSAWKGGNA